VVFLLLVSKILPPTSVSIPLIAKYLLFTQFVMTSVMDQFALYDDVIISDTESDDVRAKYLLFTFIMNIVTILITVIIINWNFRTPQTHRMPRWIRVIFLDLLPRLIMMTRPSHSCRWYRTQRALCQAATSADNLRQVRQQFDCV